MAYITQHRPFIWYALPIAWQMLFCFAPCLALFLTAFEQWSFAPLFNCMKPLYGLVIARSIMLASGTAIACLLVGYPVAYYIACKAQSLKTFWLFLLILPLWTNFLLHISAWFFVLEQQGFLNNILRAVGIIKAPLHLLHSPLSIAIMMLHYYLPFMVLPLYTQLERFNLQLLEASADLGATWRQTVQYVLLPSTLTAIRSGFLLVFVPACGEFVIPELMGGDKTMFVGSVISHYILGSDSLVQGAAFTVVSTCALIGAAICWFYLLEKIITVRR